jgi:hypothetical protein
MVSSHNDSLYLVCTQHEFFKGIMLGNQCIWVVGHNHQQVDCCSLPLATTISPCVSFIINWKQCSVNHNV